MWNCRTKDHILVLFDGYSKSLFLGLKYQSLRTSAFWDSPSRQRAGKYERENTVGCKWGLLKLPAFQVRKARLSDRVNKFLEGHTDSHAKEAPECRGAYDHDHRVISPDGSPTVKW